MFKNILAKKVVLAFISGMLAPPILNFFMDSWSVSYPAVRYFALGVVYMGVFFAMFFLAKHSGLMKDQKN